MGLEPVPKASLSGRTLHPTRSQPMERWCDCFDAKIVAHKSVAPQAEGPNLFGYVMECDKCREWRFLIHDWRIADATFEKVTQ